MFCLNGWRTHQLSPMLLFHRSSLRGVSLDLVCKSNLFTTSRISNLFTTPRRSNLFTASRRSNLFTTSRISNLFTASRRMANSKYEYVRKFEEANDLVLLPNCYIVVRVDGHDFHKFSKLHKFHKPNDKRCLDLLVKSAQHVMGEFAPWITIAYGQSDEFSFLFRKSAEMHRRRQSKLTSLLASTFTSAFVLNWSQFFPSTRLLYPPTFDSRCVLYPDEETVRDYFRWRQVDCHINNLYNTTFHALIGEYQVVKLVEKPSGGEEKKPSGGEEKKPSGGEGEGFEVTKLGAYEDPSVRILTPQEATKRLEGSLSSDKNELLFSTYGINYNNELEQFRKGSTILLTNGSDFDQKWLRKEERKKRKEEASSAHAHECRVETIVLTRDVIKEQFWIENSTLL